MFSRLSFFAKHSMKIRSLVELNQTPRIYVQSKILSNNYGYTVRDLMNSRQAGESMFDYRNRAWNEFLNKLQPNTYYIYLHKTRVTIDVNTIPPVTINEPGHIAGFLSNSEGQIIEGTEMSLRKGIPIADSMTGELQQYSGYLYGMHFPNLYTYSVVFVTIKTELDQYFFNLAEKSLEIPPLRYLIGIPITRPCLKDVLESVKKTKEDFSKSSYKLIDGRKEDIETKALNCISGFYACNNVTGVMKNPQAQVAAWSFLKFTLGEELRNKMLENTSIKADSIILEDDELTAVDPIKTLGGRSAPRR